MAQIRNEQDLQQFVTGCDADIGGYSSVNLTLDDEGRGASVRRSVPMSGMNARGCSGRFWGNLDATVPTARLHGEKIAQSGYAGFRTKVRYRYTRCRQNATDACADSAHHTRTPHVGPQLPPLHQSEGTRARAHPQLLLRQSLDRRVGCAVNVS